MKEISLTGEAITTCLETEIELEAGVSHPLEELEELRLFLGSMLNPSLLGSLVELHKILSQEPRQTEMYSWFCRNSQYASDCKYARMALKKFKEERIDKVEEKLEEALKAIKEIRNG